MEFELAYYDVAVQHFNHYIMGFTLLNSEFSFFETAKATEPSWFYFSAIVDLVRLGFIAYQPL